MALECGGNGEDALGEGGAAQAIEPRLGGEDLDDAKPRFARLGQDDFDVFDNDWIWHWVIKPRRVVCRGEAVTRPYLAHQFCEQAAKKRQHYKRENNLRRDPPTDNDARLASNIVTGGYGRRFGFHSATYLECSNVNDYSMV